MVNRVRDFVTFVFGTLTYWTLKVRARLLPLTPLYWRAQFFNALRVNRDMQAYEQRQQQLAATEYERRLLTAESNLQNAVRTYEKIVADLQTQRETLAKNLRDSMDTIRELRDEVAVLSCREANRLSAITEAEAASAVASGKMVGDEYMSLDLQ